MIVGLTKTMHTYIVGQPRSKSKAQSKRVDGFTYSLTTTISRNDMDWYGAYSTIIACLKDVMQIAIDDIKDMEISLDITSGLYTVRFTSPDDLTDTDYASEVVWLVESLSDCTEETSDEYPVDYVTDERYEITTSVTPLDIDDLSESTLFD